MKVSLEVVYLTRLIITNNTETKLIKALLYILEIKNILFSFYRVFASSYIFSEKRSIINIE